MHLAGLGLLLWGAPHFSNLNVDSFRDLSLQQNGSSIAQQLQQHNMRLVQDRLQHCFLVLQALLYNMCKW